MREKRGRVAVRVVQRRGRVGWYVGHHTLPSPCLGGAGLRTGPRRAAGTGPKLSLWRKAMFAPHAMLAGGF